jgi:hypothetical protein
VPFAPAVSKLRTLRPLVISNPMDLVVSKCALSAPKLSCRPRRFLTHLHPGAFRRQDETLDGDPTKPAPLVASDSRAQLR